MTIGERIKLRRKEIGLTQTELAEKMGLTSKTTICKAETANFNPTMDRVREFAKALDTTPAYLMGWEDTETKIIIKMNELSEAQHKGNKEDAERIRKDLAVLNENIHLELKEKQKTTEKALDLYEKYMRADPSVKEVIARLLKDSQ